MNKQVTLSSNASKYAQKYRPDIDGLRALAVLMVIVFHINPNWLPGGFIGVDVFFVISGYLITNIILRELSSSGAFSFKNFYLRRARRLFPALFVVVLITNIIWLFTQTPLLIKSALSESLYALTSVSNIFFWSQSGYFDADSITKPMLHTWSLSVEEQFYLFWPVFIWMIYRTMGLKVTWASIIIVSLISFQFNYIFFSIDDTSSVFFLMPFRIFEFVIGASILLFERFKLSTVLQETILIAGLTVIGSTAVVFTQDILFPGVNALLPCIGTALIIYAGRARFSGIILRNPLSIWIGKVSYSAYLIHWPLIVYFLTTSTATPSIASAFALLVCTLVLATIMYFLIEQPFRSNKGSFKEFNRYAAPLFLGSILIFAVFSFTFINQATTSNQVSYDLANIVKLGNNYTWQNMRKLNQPWPNNIDSKKILVVGDSQGADLINLILDYDKSLENNIRAFPSNKFCQIKMNTNFYLSGEYKDQYNASPKQIEWCNNDIKKYKNDERLTEADTIILAYAWYQNSEKYLPNEISYLKTINPNAEIFIVGKKDQPKSSINYLDEDVTENTASTIARQNQTVETYNVNNFLSKLDNATFLDLYSVICGATKCDLFTETGYPIFFDQRHFTQIGSRYIARSYPFYEFIAAPLRLELAKR